jgi:hypothetical protein
MLAEEKIVVFWGARGEKYILYEMEGENRLWTLGFGLWEERSVAEGEMGEGGG